MKIYPPDMMTEIARRIHDRLSRKRRLVDNFARKKVWSKCIEIEGEIVALETVWQDLHDFKLIIRDEAPKEEENGLV